MKKKDIVKLSRRDFERAWLESGRSLKKPHHDMQYPRLRFKAGKSHVLYDTIWMIREAYLRLGFSEMVNPLFIDEEHIYKQFGPEAPAVLDRCFYLGGLPRPDIGLAADKIEMMRDMGIDTDPGRIEKLKDVFRSYKKGDLPGMTWSLRSRRPWGLRAMMVCGSLKGFSLRYRTLNLLQAGQPSDPI